MRWFRSGKRQVQQDPAQQVALLQDVRQRFGPQVQASFQDQADAVTAALAGDDGLLVACRIVAEFADAAYADLQAQNNDLGRRTGYAFELDRRNYRPVWREAGADLRWSMFTLPVRLHPYIQVSAAVAVIGGDAKRLVRATDPYPVLAQLLEILDLTIAGWEFARIRVDTDAATLAHRLIDAARDLRDAMSDEPPLPAPVREMMRSNRTVEVYATDAHQVVTMFNPGKRMREQFLA
ncbi:hypothetical protein HH310_10750 [Actinoplanes sp. TBRC 11911]|uniref:hypothetical protein n=1 Tax=Actinoplanes sp. TBRC 11911 TaxID=2729386 RepID=UPI00145EC782|nr:hypothetical protein [Actinoplanes sp. TBRC 11911]NMO51667.1 hypothetical protein [Actinoplanes sp. TBRC 11911]